MTTTTTTPTPPDAPPPATKTRKARKPRPSQDDTPAVTAAPPTTDDGSNSATSPRPTELAYLDLGAALAVRIADDEAGNTDDPASVTPAEIEKAEDRSNSDRIVLSEPDVSDEVAVAPNLPHADPGVLSVEEYGSMYRAVSERPVWERVSILHACLTAHGSPSLTRFARAAHVSKTQIVEDTTLATYFLESADRCVGASPSAHLFSARLAKRRCGADARIDTVRSLARVILMQTPEITKLQALIKFERTGSADVPPPVEINSEKDAADDSAEKDDGTAAYEAILESIDEIEAFLSSGTETQVQSVIAAVERLLAQAKAPKVTTFVPVANDTVVGAA